MRLLNVETMTLEMFMNEEDLPPYTILSHCWGEKEVTFRDFQSGQYLHLKGFKKIKSCCAQTALELFQYTWIDTCCIDKESSAELSEAINSMFRWYESAAVCYAFLEDVIWDWTENTWLDEGDDVPQSAAAEDRASVRGDHGTFIHEVTLTAPDAFGSWPGGNIADEQPNKFKIARVLPSGYYDVLKNVRLLFCRPSSLNAANFTSSRWFTRGWTLQELIAPEHVVLFDGNWREIGSKVMLSYLISSITGIDQLVLCHGYLMKYPVREPFLTLRQMLSKFSVATRMYWASSRSTSRVEDIAYCLLGIFDINMPLLYGEGARAFYRLQLEIMQEGTDPTILLFGGSSSHPKQLLANSPVLFSPEFSEPRYALSSNDAEKKDAKLSLDSAKKSISLEAMTIDVGALIGPYSPDLYRRPVELSSTTRISTDCLEMLWSAKSKVYHSSTAVVVILTRSRREAIGVLLRSKYASPTPAMSWSRECNHIIRFQYDVSNGETPRVQRFKMELHKPATTAVGTGIVRNLSSKPTSYQMATRLHGDYLAPLSIQTWSPDTYGPEISRMTNIFVFSSKRPIVNQPFAVAIQLETDRVACTALPPAQTTDYFSTKEQGVVMSLVWAAQWNVGFTQIALTPEDVCLSVSTRPSPSIQQTLLVIAEHRGSQPHGSRASTYDTGSLVQLLRWDEH